MKEIKLTKGQVAIVDDDDYTYLIQHRWYASRGGDTYYPARTIRRKSEKKTILMHMQILGRYVDHINGNGLDNRRCNLRFASRRQNQWNTRRRRGKYLKGVIMKRDCNQYYFQPRIFVAGKPISLGCFSTELNAALAYDNAARKHFGEFACPNFPLPKVEGEG